MASMTICGSSSGIAWPLFLATVSVALPDRADNHVADLPP
jgi:hypothetical protein